MNLLNVIWPALYVLESLWEFWYLVIGTVLIETVVIKYAFKLSWKKSAVMSLIGNVVSGLIGTCLMVFGMLFWHLVFDGLFSGATFSSINWVATFILMCLGSVFLEAFAVKIIYKEKMRRLFLPLLTGNFLSYLFIAIFMLVGNGHNVSCAR